MTWVSKFDFFRNIKFFGTDSQAGHCLPRPGCLVALALSLTHMRRSCIIRFRRGSLERSAAPVLITPANDSLVGNEQPMYCHRNPLCAP